MSISRIPSPEDLWASHEKRVLEVFVLALTMLREEKSVPAEEDVISEILALKTREANLCLKRHQKGLPYAPVREARNQPQSVEDLDSEWARKKPDFQCQMIDESDDNPKTAYRNYCIECKRIGAPPGAGWILNKNYVTKGIVRFLDASHGYGKGAKSGSMIGYVLSMDLDDILAEINSFSSQIIRHSIPALRFSPDSYVAVCVSQTSQHLTRREVEPSSFDLRHLWVDLRQ